jgi:hypothetical protein
LLKVYRDSDEGSSILEANFLQMNKSVEAFVERIKNAFSNIWYTIFTPMAEAFKPAMLTISEGIVKIQKFFESNKEKITAIFKDLGEQVNGIFQDLFPKVQSLVEKIFDAFSGKSYTLPMFSYIKPDEKNGIAGGVMSTDKKFKGSNDFGSNLSNILNSGFSLVSAYIEQMTTQFSNVFTTIGEFIGKGAVLQIQAMTPILVEVGVSIAKGFINAIPQAFKKHPLITTGVSAMVILWIGGIITTLLKDLGVLTVAQVAGSGVGLARGVGKLNALQNARYILGDTSAIAPGVNPGIAGGIPNVVGAGAGAGAFGIAGASVGSVIISATAAAIIGGAIGFAISEYVKVGGKSVGEWVQGFFENIIKNAATPGKMGAIELGKGSSLDKVEKAQKMLDMESWKRGDFSKMAEETKKKTNDLTKLIAQNDTNIISLLDGMMVKETILSNKLKKLSEKSGSSR